MFEVNRLHKLLGIRSSRTNRWKCVRSALSKQGVAFVRVQGASMLLSFSNSMDNPLSHLLTCRLSYMQHSSFFSLFPLSLLSITLVPSLTFCCSFPTYSPPSPSPIHPQVAMNLHSPLNSLPSLAIDVHSNILIFYATIILGLVSHQQPPRPIPHRQYETNEINQQRRDTENIATSEEVYSQTKQKKQIAKRARDIRMYYRRLIPDRRCYRHVAASPSRRLRLRRV